MNMIFVVSCKVTKISELSTGVETWIAAVKMNRRRRLHFPPADNETDTCRKEAGTEAAVEPGNEGVGDLRDALLPYHSGKHHIEAREDDN